MEQTESGNVSDTDSESESTATKPPTLDDIFEIRMQTPLKEKAPPDSLMTK